MAELSAALILSPAARVAWRRAADELLIDAIFGDLTVSPRRSRRAARASTVSSARTAEVVIARA